MNRYLLLMALSPCLLTQGLVSKGIAQPTYETNVTVQTFAGSGFLGYLDGTGVATMFNWPLGICMDTASNLFVADAQNFRIRKITAAGTVTTIAGSGQVTFPVVNGQGTNASFNTVTSLAVDHIGNIYAADVNGIRLITSTGWVTNFAGDPNAAGYADNAGTNARFKASYGGVVFGLGICIDGGGNLFVADAGNHRIRKVTTNGVVSTVAGSGNPGFVDGNGIFTSFAGPTGVAVDQAGNIFVADAGNNSIRKITTDGTVSTFAGNGNQGFTDANGTNAAFRLSGTIFTLPQTVGAQIAVDHAGFLYVADIGNNSIRRISPAGDVRTLAGSLTPGFTNGPGSTARFKSPCALVVDETSAVFVTDAGNHRIRSLTAPQTLIVAPADLGVAMYAGITINGIIGRSYRIESTADAGLSNGWTGLATIALPTNPYLWIDTQSTNAARRFYRAVLLP